MNELIGRVFSFETKVFPNESALYNQLASHGQSPKALMISCADSRVVPEHIMQAQPGDLFVCRNAGNIVPPHATQNGGVTSTVEYAVMVLGVRDIIVCGHSDCGAMKALSTNADLTSRPTSPRGCGIVTRRRRSAAKAIPTISPTRKSCATWRWKMSWRSLRTCGPIRPWHPASRVARSRCMAGMSTSMRARCLALTVKPDASCRCVKVSPCRSHCPMAAASRPRRFMRKRRSNSC